MKEYDFIINSVKNRLDQERFDHTIRVCREAEALAVIYGANVDKCKVASLIHDMAKNLSDSEMLESSKNSSIDIDEIQYYSPQLLHGPLAAALAHRDFNIEDEEILNAVRYHTTGRAGMSIVEKIVYLADLIEEGRSFKGLEELRRLAYSNLDEALIVSCNNTIDYVIRRNLIIHPFTIDFRNNLLLKGRVRYE